MINQNRQYGGKTPVRAELLKQLVLIGVIAAIAVWQHHFVIQAASADIYIFALLFGTAFFGCYNTVRGTYNLKNEFLALEALKQVHDDCLREAAEPLDHARVAAERFKQHAIVYDTPKALATAHRLIKAELLRNGSLIIPPATMQVLVSDLETKLDERQGMAHYLGALMVLLGLLGTFIGLMHTLESVGGILGSLDLSGNGGTDAIANLIESLKLPLEGMSTGFGASLFGLIGSLVIGVLSKFDSKVAHHLQHDFESWLRNAVQFEAARRHDDQTLSSSDAPNAEISGNWRTILQVARNTVLATSKLSARQVELAESLDRFREEFAERERSWERHFLRVSRVLEDQLVTQDQIRFGIEKIRSDANEVGDQICQTIVRGQRSLDGHLLDYRGVLETNSVRISRLDDVITLLFERHGETNCHLRSIETKVAAALGQSAGDPEPLADRATALVADLEHLIAATRLNNEDVTNLRKLSRLMANAQASGTSEVTPVETVRGFE
jgi:biopolymer transport protein ExbB/TolQ